MARKLYVWARGNHLPHRTTAARVRPGEHYPQTEDDGPGSFCLPCIFSLCSGIPKRYRQIRGTGCNPNLHLFTQGWAGKCFKSNFNTMAVKSPAPLGCVTGFRCGWEGSVLCSPAVPPPQTRILIPTIPITFDKVRFLHLTDTDVADTSQDITSVPDPHSFARLQIPSTPSSSFATIQTRLQNT